MHSQTKTNGAASAVIAGPILRRLRAQRMVLWLAVSEPIALKLALYRQDHGQQETPDDVVDLAAHTRDIRIGERAWLLLIDIDFAAAGIAPLGENVAIGYDLWLGAQTHSLAELEPGLCYDGERRPRFVFRTRLDNVLHGSCRRPHHPSGDGMARADRWLSQRREYTNAWPTVMLLTGDQIYADDVAGPLLRAIHALIERLGLWSEQLEGSVVDDSAGLYASEHCYYRRDDLLPHEKSSRALRERFFGGTEKPVFTSASSGNHLITLAEVLAMYLLCWSDAPWRELSYSRPALNEEEGERYDEEAGIIRAFVDELPGARRIMANTPVAMIFDDHDITDDWNLTGLWMDSAYGHPFSRRIIGNALVAYLLCQGWGNRPEAFEDTILPALTRYTAAHDKPAHDDLVEAVLDFHDWGFILDTEPAVVLLDTRTRRWRRVRKPSHPSGLMDWEALSDMQSHFMGRDSVVIVSAAPIFGVKLIENIQRIFTWFGKPLMVDAENWMAHPGSAHTLLNIFRHRATPRNFTVLSGDVHYSFVYDVTLRHGDSRQKIWQITSSGVKNEFPRRLLDWFDRLNRWLFAPYSPLNWFTKRRRMRVSPRRPSPASHGERLVNGAGMGFVRFNDAGQPVDIRELGVDDRDVSFDQTNEIEV
ncbi:alkaline phosphatase family protein [Salinisphaera aquimarina]|uniref:Alkaline phosphatase family protein n=1 Tax=Salinisphaera aquimarina TaxID=2094031 RepID=A0ABV7EUC4_9GAMM